MDESTGPLPVPTRDPDTPAQVPTTRVDAATPATGPRPPAPAGPLSVHGYDRFERIGQGGMGTVYRARDVRLGRSVAVKVLQEDLQDNPAAVRRFVDEARITGRLQHPGIPPVHEVGRLPDGRPFLAMKLIKGETLAKRLAAGKTPRGELVGMFEQVCHAVAYAHAHKVIHRDLKPENVMVGAFNEVQVMDWGLAKVRTAGEPAPARPAVVVSTFHDPRTDDGDGSQTRAGSVLGTPAYMPPEQAIGAVDQVDERSDVFGLGAILCAVLTGKPPYAGTDSESTRQLAARGKLKDAFARLDKCGAEPDLVALCRRCLSPEPVDRPADADEVAKAVAGLRAAAAERARKAELDRVRAEGELRAAELRAAEARKRRRIQMALVAAIGLILTGGAVGGWWADRITRQRKADADRQRLEDEHRAEVERDRLGRTGEAVGTLLGQCEDALRADDADKAALLSAAAGNRAAEGGAEEHSARLERCRTDLALLRDLDRVDAQRWTLVKGAAGYPLPEKWAPGLAQAFARCGLVPGTTPPAEAARRVAGSPVRDRVLTGLDLWLSGVRSAAVADLLKAIDPDEFRDSVRAAVVAGDEARVGKLAAEAKAREQPVRFAAVLGSLNPVPQDVRKAVLDVALQKRPGDFGLLMDRAAAEFVGGFGGVPEGGPGPLAGQQQWYRAAVALRPKNAAAHHNLGAALADSLNPDAAVPEFREAVRLDPDYFQAQFDLGDALRKSGHPADAVTAYREARRLQPDDPAVHLNLGLALHDLKDLAGAATEFKEAIRLDEKDDRPHVHLGNTLTAQGDVDGAIAEYQKATRLNPDNAEAQYQLGLALHGQQDLAGAVAAYKEVVRLDPDKPHVHHNLAIALYSLGDVARAVAQFRAAIELDPANAAAHRNLGLALQNQGDFAGAEDQYREAIKQGLKAADVDPLIRRLHRWQELGPRLKEVAAGERKPDSPADGCELAELAARPFHRRYRLAVRLYEKAFAAEPGLTAANRYNAACAAARVVAGNDADGAPVGPDERARLTGLAYDWLQADLTDLKGLPADPKVRRTLAHWRNDPDLPAVRDPARLAAMPAADRERWEALWAEVDELLKAVARARKGD